MHEPKTQSMATVQLREARLAAGLELSDIEQRTRISPSILRWIDEGQFHRLPAGIYARSYVRAFAQAVGLDPAGVVASVEHELPPASDSAPVAALPAGRPAAARRWPLQWLRFAAAAVDAAVLSIVYSLVLVATAAVCRRPVGEIVNAALPAVVMMLILLTALYFLVFAGVQGRTPGARVFGLPAFAARGPVHLGAIAVRALRVFASEASISAELVAHRSAAGEVSTVEPYGSRSTP